MNTGSAGPAAALTRGPGIRASGGCSSIGRVQGRIVDWPLRVKLVAVSAALVAGLAAALLFGLPRALDAQSRGWLESRSLAMARLLGHALEAAVDFEDARAAGAALDALQDARGTAYAVLLRADGSPLSAHRSPDEPTPLAVGGGEAATFAGGLLHVRVPIVTRSGRVATLLMGFSLDELGERRREARRTVLLSAAVFLLVGLISSFVVAQLVARPLARITEVARRVAAGQEQPALRLPLGRADEVGVLATAFHQMLDRLSAQQEQLVMADRRVSIGRLAAGVAHEINNPLSFLAGNLDYVAAELPNLAALISQGHPEATGALLQRFGEAVDDTREGARRVASIVKGLRTFARDDQDRRERVRLDAPLEAAIEMAMHEIKHRARLVRRFECLPHVMGSEVRLSQVFLNLLVNAAHAIPEGAPARNEIRVSLRLGSPSRALVEVADTGSGISEAERGRIFDPFFTTKPVGEGSGLGLSISRNIVEKLGGEIGFDTEVGRGSTFRVSLPLAQAEEAALPEAAPDRPPPPLPAGYRLLVVDDEPMVGAAVKRALDGDLQVVVAGSGREALEHILAGERFDRVLCDVMMPGMSGEELLAEVSRRAPQLRDAFVFMTGGAFTEVARGFVEAYGGPLLEKPLDVATLRRVLREGLT